MIDNMEDPTRKEKMAEIVKSLGAIIGDDQETKNDFVATLLGEVGAPVPASLLSMDNLPFMANSVVTDDDVKKARMSTPHGTITYVVRDTIRYPRKMNVWIGRYEDVVKTDIYRQAMSLIMSVRDGGIVTRKHNRPIESDGKTIGKIPVPAEEIDSIWIGMEDSDGAHPREILKISTAAGRVFVFDPECPQDPDDAESEKIPGGVLTVTGGVKRTPGYRGCHRLDQDRGMWRCEQDASEQQFIRGGMAPANVAFEGDEPAPYMVKERTGR